MPKTESPVKAKYVYHLIWDSTPIGMYSTPDLAIEAATAFCAKKGLKVSKAMLTRARNGIARGIHYHFWEKNSAAPDLDINCWKLDQKIR